MPYYLNLKTYIKWSGLISLAKSWWNFNEETLQIPSLSTVSADNPFHLCTFIHHSPWWANWKNTLTEYAHNEHEKLFDSLIE
jgi:hypothetical protein